MRHGRFAGLATFAVGMTQLLSAPLLAEEADRLGETLQPVGAYVYHCHDGDTCRLRVAGGMWLNVRLAGIDAPEVGGKKKGGGQPMGAEARDFLNGKLKGKAVRVRQVDLDQYNRPVVELTLAPVDPKASEGIPVNRELVAEGYAEMYRGKGKRWDKGAYEEAEAAAKKGKKGIWGIAGYQSPAEFRKAKR